MGCKASAVKEELKHIDKEIDIVQKIKEKIKDRTMNAVDDLFKIPVNTSISQMPSFKQVKMAIEEKDRQLEEMRAIHQNAMTEVEKKLNALDSVVVRKADIIV